MGVLKASAISLALFATLVSLAAVVVELKTAEHPSGSGLGAAVGGFAVLAGFCFLGSAILTAVQPFVPSRPAGPGPTTHPDG